MSTFTHAQLQIRRLFQGQPTAPCYWCAKILWPKEATRDHKLPRADGGGGAIANFVLACPSCNCQRGDIPFEEFEDLWERRRGKALDAAQFDLIVRNKLQARQFVRTKVGPKVSLPRQLSVDRCKLCAKLGCDPGNHRITWMHNEYCPWCWAMACTPEVHKEGLKAIEQ